LYTLIKEIISGIFFTFPLLFLLTGAFYTPNMNTVNVTADKAMDAHQQPVGFTG